MFTKEQIKEQWNNYKQSEIDAGHQVPKSSINLALLILSSSLFTQKDWGGRDYSPHPIHVAFNKTDSDIKIIIGILHDVVEDSDWTVDDLREIGFHERVCVGVDNMTKREEESYFEFIERCGLSYLNKEGNLDAIDNKIADLKHNSDRSRTKGLVDSDYANRKGEAYNISLYYLIDIKKGKIDPGTPIIDFLRKDPVYSAKPEQVNRVLDYFSNSEERLPVAVTPSPAPSI
jgi:hypothetical protein